MDGKHRQIEKFNKGTGLPRSLQAPVCLICIGMVVGLTACSTGPRNAASYTGSTITSAVVNDPEVLAASEGVAQADARLDGARAEMLPSVSLNASLVSEDPNAGSSRDVEDSLGFRASLPLFRGFGTLNGMHQARAEQSAAGSGYDTALASAVVRLVNAMAQVDRDRQVVAVREQELVSLRTFLRESQQRRSSGIISGADVDQIRVQVAEVEAELAQSQGALRGSEARQASLLGSIDFDLVDVQDVAAFLPASEAEAIQTAVAENPVLAEAHWRAEAARRGVQVAMASLAPSADFSIVGEQANGGILSDSDDLDLEFRVDVEVPLFNGGRRLADIRESQSVHRELGHRYQAAHRDVIADVQGAWARYVAAETVERVSNERLTAARRALTATREARRIGARTITNELDARRDALNAQVAVADAALEIIVASHDLLLQTGRINLAYNLSD
jgi:outer membrane protein TolC